MGNSNSRDAIRVPYKSAHLAACGDIPDAGRIVATKYKVHSDAIEFPAARDGYSAVGRYRHRQYGIRVAERGYQNGQTRLVWAGVAIGDDGTRRGEEAEQRNQRYLQSGKSIGQPDGRCGSASAQEHIARPSKCDTRVDVLVLQGCGVVDARWPRATRHARKWSAGSVRGGHGLSKRPIHLDGTRRGVGLGVNDRGSTLPRGPSDRGCATRRRARGPVSSPAASARRCGSQASSPRARARRPGRPAGRCPAACTCPPAS